MDFQPMNKENQRSTPTEVETIDLTNDSPSDIKGGSPSSVSLVLEQFDLSPVATRKRNGARRVTASPATSLALTLQERSSNTKCEGAVQAVGDGKTLMINAASLDQALKSSDVAKSNSNSGRKRKAANDSDAENQGDGNNERESRATRKKSYHLSLRGKFDDVDVESRGALAPKPITTQGEFDDVDVESRDDLAPKPITAQKRDDSYCDLTLSSSSENEDNMFRSKPSWMGSNDAKPENMSDDTSSDEEDSSSDDENDEMIKALERGDWLNSSSRGDKLSYLKTIDKTNNKALQLLLWDIGFDYKIHPHQFEAIRFTAGFIPSFPCALKETAGADDHSDSSDDSGGEDDDVQEMLQLDEYGRQARSRALDNKQYMLAGRGMILADEMGLGKTIESLAGAVLRNAAKKKKRPTLVVAPQDGVMHQWLDALSTAGVESARIRVLGEKRSETKKRGGKVNLKNTVQRGEYILCTRYKIQSEMKNLFDYNVTSELHANKKASILFSSVPNALIKKLKLEYDTDKGKVTGRRNRMSEPGPDRVTRCIEKSDFFRFDHRFETVVIDECHFLRNVLAYWGIGAALLGAQAARSVLLSGTPYNNGPKDMSALMTFIDPSHESARIKWWENATARMKRNEIIIAVSAWKDLFMLRREKDILFELPSRERHCIDVPARPSELGIYEWYEAVFLKALNQLQEEIDDSNRKAQREMVDIMMACMACMRMSLIHPILPQGREITIQFSPSRRHLLRQEEQMNKKKCVLCGDNITQKMEDHAAKIAGEVEDKDDVDYFRQLLGPIGRARSDDNIIEDGDIVSKMKDVKEDKEKGPIVKLGPDICKAAVSDCCHFAHERCIKIFTDNGGKNCPRCHDLGSRIHFESSCGATGSKKVYCQHIGTTVNSSKGFTASAKIQQAIEWFQTCVPKDDKAIILSFFKGSLDLIEGVLEEELHVKCCRYDGDVPKETRSRDLHRFKTQKKCRVLLASVQSGGTGLNITEANHVLFLDRWFNPQIHDQAESRCHRLGQKKDVKVSYLDVSYTVDVVMKQVNILKEGNSAVLLADGTSLGNNSTINYHSLQGIIGETLKAVIARRHAIIMENGNVDAPMISCGDSDLEEKLHEAIESTAEKKPRVKAEDISISDDDVSCDDDDNDECEDSIPMNSDDSNVQLVNLKETRSKLSTDNDPSDDAQSTSLDKNNIDNSDDDSDDELINGPPTFAAKPREKAKSATTTSNEKAVDMPSKFGTGGNGRDDTDDDFDDELINGPPTFPAKPRVKAKSVTTNYKIAAAMQAKFGTGGNGRDDSDDDFDDELINEPPTFSAKHCGKAKSVTTNTEIAVDMPAKFGTGRNDRDDSDDDFDDELINGPSTFPAKPHGEAIESTAANEKVGAKGGILSSMLQKSKMPAKLETSAMNSARSSAKSQLEGGARVGNSVGFIDLSLDI